MATETDAKFALVTLRTTMDALRMAQSACAAADLGGQVDVAGSLERMRRDLSVLIAVLDRPRIV